jgi:hypothetical protein
LVASSTPNSGIVPAVSQGGPASTIAAGEQIGAYVVSERIGSGGLVK